MRSPLEIRYRFGPLERRGWVGSLRPGQLLVLSLGGLGTFVPLHGRTLNEWLPVVGIFMARRASGRHRYRSGAPEAGTRFAGGDEPVKLPDSIGKVELLSFPFRGVELGVLADRATGTYSAVIQARARSFVLLDPADKAHRLVGWAGAIAGHVYEGCPM